VVRNRNTETARDGPERHRPRERALLRQVRGAIVNRASQVTYLRGTDGLYACAPVRAVAFGGLLTLHRGVNKRGETIRGAWVVTHAPTGYAVCRPSNSKLGRVALRRLETETPRTAWDTDDPKEPVRRIEAHKLTARVNDIRTESLGITCVRPRAPEPDPDAVLYDGPVIRTTARGKRVKCTGAPHIRVTEAEVRAVCFAETAHAQCSGPCGCTVEPDGQCGAGYVSRISAAGLI